MKLTQDLLETIAKDISSAQSRLEREDFHDRHLMYHGRSLEIIKKNFRKEFKKPETINQLDMRITPINITQKVINKKAGVFIESPLRYAMDKNESDQELIALYEEHLNLNPVMKEANRQMEQFKSFLLELFIDTATGCPGIRSLPRHTYKVYSINSIRPEEPNVFCKILNDDIDSNKMAISVTTDLDSVVINGNGKTIPSMMNENANGVNDYGVAPYIFKSKSSSTCYPEQDDDLHRMSIAIPILLSDLNFATKYQCWSIIYTIGQIGDIPFSPNSLVELDYGPEGQRPEIGTVKPNVDSEKIIALVTNLLTMLLSSQNLSAGDLVSTLTPGNVASGVSKMLDSAEMIEDRKDQQAIFYQAEYKLWRALSKFLIPYWRSKNFLKPVLNYSFSDVFEIGVIFKEPKAMLSPKEKIELEKMKRDAGFTTLKRALAELNTEMDAEEIDELAREIREEKLESLAGQITDGLQRASEVEDRPDLSGDKKL